MISHLKMNILSETFIKIMSVNIKKQTPEMCLSAMKQSYKTFHSINEENRTPEIYSLWENYQKS